MHESLTSFEKYMTIPKTYPNLHESHSKWLIIWKYKSFALNHFYLFRNVADELRIFESIHHPHLINHFGVEVHREEMLIFMEYCPEGTLEVNIINIEDMIKEMAISIVLLVEH